MHLSLCLIYIAFVSPYPVLHSYFFLSLQILIEFASVLCHIPMQPTMINA